MAREAAARRSEETGDGTVVLFPVRPVPGPHAPAVDTGERPAIADAPAIASSERATVATAPVPRWLRIGIVASLAIHLGLFAALAWRFANDLERAAGVSAAASAEGAIVIPIEVVVQAALPSAPSPTNATTPTAQPLVTPNPAPQEQANVPEPALPPPPEPEPVVLDIPTEAPRPALPVEASAKPREIETKETPEAPRPAIERPKQAVKQVEKRKQARAEPTAAATPNRAAGARGTGQAGAGGQSPVGGTAAVSSYQAMVLAHLQRHRVYPPAARERGITGVAAVRFALAADGSVISAALARSSGESILDNAAVDMVRRASPFPPFPPGMGRARLDFAAPIRFDLR
jgi:protein TonB